MESDDSFSKSVDSLSSLTAGISNSVIDLLSAIYRRNLIICGIVCTGVGAAVGVSVT